MLALKASGQPATNAELAPYLNALLKLNLVELAYANWQVLQPKPASDRPEFLTNEQFERDPSGLPFDWQIARGQNALAEFVTRPQAPSQGLRSQRALQITFETGRVRFPDVSQIIVLPVGSFRFEGKYQGSITAKRGLRWQFRCHYGARKILATTEMLQGQAINPQLFAVDVSVPDNDDCRGQELRLFHDARSTSEELISGEAWLSDLKLVRTDLSPAAKP
jgi:hypothetical protein